MTTNDKKAKVQAEANISIDNNQGFGLIAMATGTGKSKIGVERASIVHYGKGTTAKILLVVPTEKLRDRGWKEEFFKWNKDYLWETCIERTCYASLDTYKDQEWDLVILDEAHNITENNSIFFKKNTVLACIGLTATPPIDFIKVQLLSDILKVPTYRNDKNLLRLRPTYQITLDQAVEMELVAPYDITVITMPLDTKNAYIKKDYKDKNTGQAKFFMQTELANYTWLTQQCDFGRNPMNRINRMRFIYTLKSKTEAAKMILKHVIPEELRTLIFCGSKDQANQVSDYRFYSKPSKPKKLSEKDNTIKSKFDKWFAASLKYQEELKYYQDDASYNKFKAQEINRLSCVQALNEGDNIDNVDVGFIIQLNSQELDLIQRLGRIIRHREGHTGKIIILTTENTVDKEWTVKATAKLNNTKIRWITLEDLRLGKETIEF